MAIHEMTPEQVIMVLAWWGLYALGLFVGCILASDAYAWLQEMQDKRNSEEIG